jgi:predicted dehydrogenase
MNRTKLAIIGAGTVVTEFYLPVIRQSKYVDLYAVVDKDKERLNEVADKYEVNNLVLDYNEIKNDIDAAIIAVPNHLHYSIAVDLLQQGVDVLVEKPMALTVRECDEMINAGNKSDAVLFVGLVRRYWDLYRFLKKVLKEGLLGEMISIDIREGANYNWNPASYFMFEKSKGGGLLYDIGVHVLDTIVWCFGDCTIEKYYDDSKGGVESNCEIYFSLLNGTKGIVELSRNRQLRNTMIIRFENGNIEIGQQYNSFFNIEYKGEKYILNGHVIDRNGISNNNKKMKDCIAEQLNDFFASIGDGKSPSIDGYEGKRSVELIEQCIGIREELNYPWEKHSNV